MTSDAVPRGAQLRKHQRCSVDFPVSYLIEKRSAVTHGTVRDIGGGGISFESGEPLNKGTTLHLRFALRPGLHIEVWGRLVGSDPRPTGGVYRHRLTFTKIPDDVRNAILAYVFEAWRTLLLSQA